MDRHVAALIFDMDGTLLESHGVITEAYAATLKAIGAPARSREDIVDAFPLGPTGAILARLLGGVAADGDVDEYFRQLGFRAPRIRAYSGIPSVLATLRERVPLAVFSGASARSCEILLGATGLRRNLAAVVGGDEVERRKPAPDGIVEACRRLGLAPRSVAYVGDSPLDAESAGRAGALAVAAGWGELFDGATGADVVVDVPEDLLRLAPIPWG
jgi:phosphoglycolate phosphatase-like HAD superfamily hydrolase